MKVGLTELAVIIVVTAVALGPMLVKLGKWLIRHLPKRFRKKFKSIITLGREMEKTTRIIGIIVCVTFILFALAVFYVMNNH